MKKITLLALGLIMTIGISASTFLLDYFVEGQTCTFQDGDVVMGTLSVNATLLIANDATVTLDGVRINPNATIKMNSNGHAGIQTLGKGTIILKGTNKIWGFGGAHPAVFINKKGSLRIYEDEQGGSLEAHCGQNTNGGEYAAGIGAGMSGPSHDGSCGDILIYGGTITATGGAEGAGIGGGPEASCGNIYIMGNPTITATGGTGAAGIGAGMHEPANGSNYNAKCKSIIIWGGNITATGGDGAAGIGGGENSHVGQIHLWSDAWNVTAGDGAPYSVGKGSGESTVGEVRVFENDLYTGGVTTNPFIYNQTPVVDIPCDAPTSLTASDITTSSATITWNPVAGQRKWDVQYSNRTASEGWHLVTVTSPILQLNGLVAGAEYRVVVEAYCGTDEKRHDSSPYAAMNFTTLTVETPEQQRIDCPEPMALSASNITSTSATITWIAGSEETQWTVGYRESDNITAPWSMDGTTKEEYKLTGLKPNTRYHFYVQAECNEVSWSTTPNLYFTTQAGEGIDNVQSDKQQGTKVLRDGQLFIEINGHTYDAQGKEIK